MKIVVSTILFLCNWLFVYGQKETDYYFYFEQILKANEEISNRNYSESLKFYLNTFKNYNFVFACDAYNACQIASLINRKEEIDSLIYLCGKSGISKSRLFKNRYIFREYQSDTIKYNSFYLSGRKEYLKRVDYSLRNEIQKRYTLEQKNKGGKNYKDICNENFNRILELCKKGRFPGEQLIGIDDELGNAVVFATLANYPNSYLILRQYLDSALKYGEARPLQIIYLYGMNQSRVSALYKKKNDVNIEYDTLNFKIYFNIGFGKRSDCIDEVNAERKKLNIFSIETENKLNGVIKQDSLDFRWGY